MPDLDPHLIVSLPMALAFGLFFGMGPCLVSCLPMLGPVFLASEGGVKQSWRILLPLSLGRLTAYSGMGWAAGWAGKLLAAKLAGSVISVVVGAAALSVGLALLLRRRQACATSVASTQQPLTRMNKPTERPALMPSGLYLMGIGMALSPCVPLSQVLLTAALSSNPWQGLGLGVCFGLGALLVPSLVYGFGFAYFSQQLRQQLGPWRPRLEWLAAGLMLATGANGVIKGALHYQDPPAQSVAPTATAPSLNEPRLSLRTSL